VSASHCGRGDAAEPEKRRQERDDDQDERIVNKISGHVGGLQKLGGLFRRQLRLATQTAVFGSLAQVTADEMFMGAVILPSFPLGGERGPGPVLCATFSRRREKGSAPADWARAHEGKTPTFRRSVPHKRAEHV
jgi:hypothetical protein